VLQDGADGEPLAHRPQSSAAYVHLRSSSPGLLTDFELFMLCDQVSVAWHSTYVIKAEAKALITHHFTRCQTVAWTIVIIVINKYYCSAVESQKTLRALYRKNKMAVSCKLEVTSQIYEQSKSNVFSRLLKVGRDGDVIMSDSRLFKMRAAATPKARSPPDVLVECPAQALRQNGVNRRESMSATRCSSHVRYNGAIQCWQQKDQHSELELDPLRHS